MEKLMICPKSKGNTYDVCRYVADHADVLVEVASASTQIDVEDFDVIVLASGIYGGNLHKNIYNWVKTIKKEDLKADVKIYLFLTWLGRSDSDQTAYKTLKELLAEKGIALEEDYMECYGKAFGFVKTGHPNEEDFSKVLSWVENL